MNIPLRKSLPDLRQDTGSSSWQNTRQNAWKISILPFLLFILIPLVALFLRTNSSIIVESLNKEQVLQAIQLSMATSLITVGVTLIIGTPVAYYLAHPHYRFHNLVDSLVDLPIVLPPAVAGVALLMAFGRSGVLGGWLSTFGISLPFTFPAVVLAQTFVAAPLYIKSAAIGLGSVDQELRHAAAIDGASRWQTFWYVTMRLAWVSILSGSVMTWARALGEFGATIIFAGNFPGRTQTMPLAIYLGFEIDLRVALVLSVILVLLSFATILLVKIVLQRSISGGFQSTNNG